MRKILGRSGGSSAKPACNGDQSIGLEDPSPKWPPALDRSSGDCGPCGPGIAVPAAPWSFEPFSLQLRSSAPRQLKRGSYQ
jgi:hypothetical protein